MSPAFIADAVKSFPHAAITFDRFHVVKLLNEVMDKVRRVERIEHKALKGHQYTFLKTGRIGVVTSIKSKKIEIGLFMQQRQIYDISWVISILSPLATRAWSLMFNTPPHHAKSEYISF